MLGIESAMAEVFELAPGLLGSLTAQERAIAADDIVGLHIDTVAARCLGYRGFARYVKSGTAPEQALMKAYASETRRELGRVIAEWVGPDSMAVDPSRRWGGIGTLDDYFTTFGSTISAGSSEIQRNIIAERVLGLPRG